MVLNILAASIILTLLDVLEDFTLDINDWTDIFLVYFPFLWKKSNDIAKVSDAIFDFWITIEGWWQKTVSEIIHINQIILSA